MHTHKHAQSPETSDSTGERAVVLVAGQQDADYLCMQSVDKRTVHLDYTLLI